MKNINIINLLNNNILAITANDLDAAQAYKVLKFKRAVKKADDDITEAEKALIKEVGIEDPEAFDKERAELRKSGDNPERLAELDKQGSRFFELRGNLYNEDVKLDVKAIPYEQFHILQKENENIKGRPLNSFEELLENVLWVAPEGE